MSIFIGIKPRCSSNSDCSTQRSCRSQEPRAPERFSILRCPRIHLSDVDRDERRRYEMNSLDWCEQFTCAPKSLESSLKRTVRPSAPAGISSVQVMGRAHMADICPPYEVVPCRQKLQDQHQADRLPIARRRAFRQLHVEIFA